MKEFNISTTGFAMEDKICKKATDKACHVYLPVSWEGKHVRVILLDEIEGN